MSQVLIYHNPKCSKSRQALALLQENAIQPTIIEYLKTPPSAAELVVLIKKLAIPARELLRKNEDEYIALGLADEKLSEQQIITAMVEHPKLIERPIVINGDKAVVARPPERVLEIV